MPTVKFRIKGSCGASLMRLQSRLSSYVVCTTIFFSLTPTDNNERGVRIGTSTSRSLAFWTESIKMAPVALAALQSYQHTRIQVIAKVKYSLLVRLFDSRANRSQNILGWLSFVEQLRRQSASFWRQTDAAVRVYSI